MHTIRQFGLRSRILFAVIVSMMSACTSMQSVTDRYEYRNNPAQVIADEVKPGDWIKISTSENKSYNLQIIHVTRDEIRGVTCQGCDPIDIKIDSINELLVEEVSVVKSAGVGAGVAVGVILALLIAVSISGGASLPPGP